MLAVRPTKRGRCRRLAAKATAGDENVVSSEFPSMGSEDFSFYLQKVPGAFLRIGARRPEWEPIPLHSPAFDVDEDVLEIGAAYFEQVARLAHDHMSGLTDGV